MEKQNSNSGEKIKLPKAFKNILKTKVLVDTYKLKKKKEKPYTYFEVQNNNKEIKSRLDYTLVFIDIEHI